jgi:hypothetical protein
MTDAWAAGRRSTPRVLGGAAALAGAVVSGAALFLPWERTCADLGRFAPGPVCTTAAGSRAGGAVAIALVVGAVALGIVVLVLRGGRAVPAAAVGGLGVASATIALGVVETLDGSTWGVWVWTLGGAIQAGADVWTLIRARPAMR